MKVKVVVEIDVEALSGDLEAGFGHDVKIKVLGLTKKVQDLTLWKKDDVLWMVQKHIRESM